MPSREDATLLLWASLLGVAGAAVFAAYRAVSATDGEAEERITEFSTTVVWPGALIFAGIAAAVIAGWKANLD